MQYLLTVLICSLLLSSCYNDPEISQLSSEVRDKFSSHLKTMPKVNYVNLFSKNPNVEEANLGRLLFSDPVLSRNNDISCATCHLTNHGFADANQISIGSLGEGGPTGNTVSRYHGKGVLSENRLFGDDGYGFKPKKKMFRNALSTVNVAFRANKFKNSGLLWDGRFGDLSFIVLLPIHTPEELCGQNPLSIGEENIFQKDGYLFDKPVQIFQTHFTDPYTGKSSQNFNYKPLKIAGVPKFRKSGVISVPNRNECLAIAIAKLNKIPRYKKLFKKIYKTDVIDDRHVGMALAMYISTHISKNTKYDKFVAGKNVLNKKELIGFSIFSADYGKEFELGGKKYKGAGCVSCHAPPLFEMEKYVSLGVKSDPNSALSRPQFLSNFNGGFFLRPRLQRGAPPKCHIEGKTILSDVGYAPDIGRAGASYEDEDCFAFRVPSLRNVIATFPYFHHGTERAEGHKFKNLYDRSFFALRNVVRYHLRGKINTDTYNRKNYPKSFFDELFQKDPLVPLYLQKFKFSDLNVEFNETEVDYITHFIATGLEDKYATIIGDLGNNVTHPKVVPSGLVPSITRDHGHQYEVIPSMER